ncbi:MAG: hypothetical protein WCJ36_01600 [Candidatus Saccharibacteria bacterium]
MHEEIEEIKETQATEIKTKTPKKRLLVSKPILISILVLVLMLASAAGAYYWRDSQANSFEKRQSDNISKNQTVIKSLREQLTNKVSNDSVACTEIAPTATVIGSIEASITSGNTAALEGYMASSVNVILAASEAYGQQTPTQAVTDVTNFISNDINSWDYNFSLPAATLNTYKQGSYSQYFTNISVVGKATNNQVISFSFDCTGKIDTVFLATTASVL